MKKTAKERESKLLKILQYQILKFEFRLINFQLLILEKFELKF